MRLIDIKGKNLHIPIFRKSFIIQRWMASTNLRDGYIYFILYYILYSYIYIFLGLIFRGYSILFIFIFRAISMDTAYIFHSVTRIGFMVSTVTVRCFWDWEIYFLSHFFFFYLYNKFYIENPDIILIENIGTTDEI